MKVNSFSGPFVFFFMLGGFFGKGSEHIYEAYLKPFTLPPPTGLKKKDRLCFPCAVNIISFQIKGGTYPLPPN